MMAQLLDRETVYSGYTRIERLRLRQPDGAEVVRELERHGDAVAVLPYDPIRRTGFIVSLFRAPAFVLEGAEALEEACAGMIDAEDDEASTVRREALEEMGLELSELIRAGRFWPSPGVCGERVTLYLAPVSAESRVAAGGGLPEEAESILVIERSLSALAAQADAGEMSDLKLFALVNALRGRQPALFAPD